MSAFTPGTRVEVHPATDAWMSGDRYGSVTVSNNTNTWVRLTRSGQLRMFANNNLITVRES